MDFEYSCHVKTARSHTTESLPNLDHNSTGIWNNHFLFHAQSKNLQRCPRIEPPPLSSSSQDFLAFPFQMKLKVGILVRQLLLPPHTHTGFKWQSGVAAGLGALHRGPGRRGGLVVSFFMAGMYVTERSWDFVVLFFQRRPVWSVVFQVLECVSANNRTFPWISQENIWYWQRPSR